MTIHKPILLEEAIENLKLKNGDIVVDATLGGGGHSSEILKKIGSEGMLIAIDTDISAINNFTKFPISNFQFPNKYKIQNTKYKILGNICLVNDNFRNLESILKELQIEKVDAILADFGISSDQLEKAERGFSFQKNSLLDMRINQMDGMTAKDVINNYEERELRKIISEYGEEKYARNIAKKIVDFRKKKPIEKTLELVEIINNSVPEKYKHQKTHFATKTFQAIRIEVNRELENISDFIPKAIEFLNKKGRLSVITFHSGEDRIAKLIFRKNARGCICPENFPICRCGVRPIVKILNSKPIVPSPKEVRENPRARSAKLRVLERI